MNNSFQPSSANDKAIPFFDDVKASEGWEGHTTSKSIERLINEIQANLALINCVFVRCQSGKFGDRLGFQIHFAMKSESGDLVPSRLDVACLPLKGKYIRHYKKDQRIEATQKMALYMTAKAIKGMHFLSVMSPDFIPFMSLMLNSSGQTMGSVWVQSGSLSNLLPAPTEGFVEGEIV